MPKKRAVLLSIVILLSFVTWQWLLSVTVFATKKKTSQSHPTVKGDHAKHTLIDRNIALPYWNRSQTRRLASPSNAIHCVQKPLFLDQGSTFRRPIDVVAKRFAYVWYASSAMYLCSALTAFRLLQQLRAEGNTTHLDVDYVLIASESDLNNSSTSKKLLQQWSNLGGLIKRFPPLPYPELGTYEATYQRFRAFQLTEYDQVIAMDADGFPLQNLDHLLLFNLPGSIKLAAPQAYWFNHRGVVDTAEDRCPGIPLVLITSILLVIKPDMGLFDRVKQHFGSTRFQSKVYQFDMDILISEFCCHDEIFILPKYYGTLDSEFQMNEPLNFDLQECRNWKYMQYLHFSYNGKPWTRSKAMNAKYYSKSVSQDALDVVKDWFKMAHHFCPKLISEHEF